VGPDARVQPRAAAPDASASYYAPARRHVGCNAELGGLARSRTTALWTKSDPSQRIRAGQALAVGVAPPLSKSGPEAAGAEQEQPCGGPEHDRVECQAGPPDAESGVRPHRGGPFGIVPGPPQLNAIKHRKRPPELLELHLVCGRVGGRTGYGVTVPKCEPPLVGPLSDSRPRQRWRSWPSCGGSIGVGEIGDGRPRSRPLLGRRDGNDETGHGAPQGKESENEQRSPHGSRGLPCLTGAWSDFRIPVERGMLSGFHISRVGRQLCRRGPQAVLGGGHSGRQTPPDPTSRPTTWPRTSGAGGEMRPRRHGHSVGALRRGVAPRNQQ